MKRIITFITISVLAFYTGFSQVTEAEKDLKSEYKDTTQGWKTGGLISLSFSSVTLTNWAAGGENSIAINGLSNFFANYKKGNMFWQNSLNLAYGLLKQGEAKKFKKTDDKIELVSKFGLRASNNWYYSALASFTSQFTAGYNYPDDSTMISNFLAPAYILTAAGMNYGKNGFNVFIAPLTMKTTLVMEESLSAIGAYGVDTGKTVRLEFGGYIRTSYRKEFGKKYLFQTKLDLFSNYLHNPQNIDVNWEVLLNMKLTKFLSAVITTNLIYDDDIKIGIDDNDDGVIDREGPRTQFKKVIGVGLSYQF